MERKVITVSNLKGGVGKSTIALHLAAFFSERGSTVLIDYDPTNRTVEHWAEQGKLTFPVTNEKKASRVLDGSQEFIVIDSPARPDDLKDLAESCDLLILPTIPNVVSVNPTIATALDLAKHHANYRVVLNCVASHPSKEGELLQGELRNAGVPVFDQMVSRSSAFERAALEGVPVCKVDDSKHRERYRKLWAQIECLGNEVLKLINTTTQQEAA